MSTGSPDTVGTPPGLAASTEVPEPAATRNTGSMDALGHFVDGTVPGGYVTQTAARLSGQPQGVAGVGGGLLQSSAPAYTPLACGTDEALRKTANELLTELVLAEQKRGTTYTWHEGFWQRVQALDAAGQLPGNLRTLLCSHGYMPLGTSTPPGPTLTAELAQIVSGGMGSSQGASGAGLAAAASMVDPSLTRIDCRLRPGLRRAAPEIYVNVRSQGAVSCRDWLLVNAPDGRKDHRWQDLWNCAITVDYAVSKFTTQAELMGFLATDDTCEVMLRRLGSYMYERRTRAAAGAAHMLAQAAPGANVDVSPDWLVSDATQHSRTEHLRNERVRTAGGQAERGGGGGGRGNGRGGRSSNPAEASANAPDEGGGGGAPRGRGRGGGGRRGRGRGQ